MGKILEGDFRKELYKNLTEAGYSKVEAQKIVGIKYYDALKANTREYLEAMISKLDGNVFEFSEKDAIEANLGELGKLKEIIS